MEEAKAFPVRSHKPPTQDQDDSQNLESFGFVNANIYQAATLNKLLPRGFKIELEEVV